MEKEKPLLQKYNIPLNHLDFAYIKECKSAREMEKIVKILRSGEEGYFPDLMRCAEEKLKELKPDSKLFRFEEAIRSSSVLDKNELKPIYDWNDDIKTKDSALNELKEETNDDDASGMPPVRTPCKIDVDKPNNESKPKTDSSQKANEKSTAKTNEQRIKSTDYGKWDKYDPDEEILRMDLEEERTKEQAQIKVKKMAPLIKEELPNICEQSVEEQRLQCQLKKLSHLEREQYGEKHRLRGNEYFNVKEYDNAIKEYTRSIVYDPEHAARSYNNRALCYIKLQNYLAAIDDCEGCLKLEPDNVKALLRLADSNFAHGRRRESHDIYQRVLNVDPNNANALKALEQLRAQLGELAPAHATRMIIEELPVEKPKPKAQVKPIAKPTKPAKEYDLAELVKPNRVVKSKMLSAAEALGGKLKGSKTTEQKNPQHSQNPLLIHPQMPSAQPELRLPHGNNNNNNMGNKKLLIQEL
ncbi:sperm-associated antigen 1 [Drosophila albomicans]|uniref:Sperm-associated antigen 1 n=1 Tax=Drosophila albomicans TaxID=7291 RepID=A0A6P8XS90_DROAB|nr:sperm-associated antigen 1 [Drosophila albomicans]